MNSLVSVLGAYSLPETSNPFAMNSGAGSTKRLLTLLPCSPRRSPRCRWWWPRRCSVTCGSGWPCRSAPAYGLGAALLGAYLAGDVLDRRSRSCWPRSHPAASRRVGQGSGGVGHEAAPGGRGEGEDGARAVLAVPDQDDIGQRCPPPRRRHRPCRRIWSTSASGVEQRSWRHLQLPDQIQRGACGKRFAEQAIPFPTNQTDDVRVVDDVSTSNVLDIGDPLPVGHLSEREKPPVNPTWAPASSGTTCSLTLDMTASSISRPS